MTLELTVARDADRDTWDHCVGSTSHGTLFHTWDWLKIVEHQTGTRFLPFILRNGDRVVALYPFFLSRKGFLRLAFSPPSRSYLLYLGPVFPGYDELKQSKKESAFMEVQDIVNSALLSDYRCHYIRIRSSPGLIDSRPFRWSGYQVEPLYTYRIDLSGGFQAVSASFDRKVRVSIHRLARDGVSVREGDRGDIDLILGSLTTRYRMQGHAPSDYRDYLHRIYERFSPEHLRIIVAEYKGEKVGGSLYLCDKGIMYMWVGVPKTDLKGLYPNDLIQWEAIRWACEHGYRYFEEMDSGNDPRLRHFKAKFNPELVIWYSAVRYSSALCSLGASVANRLRG